MGKQKTIENQTKYCIEMIKRLGIDVSNADFDGYGKGKCIVASGIKSLRRELLRLHKMIDGNNE